MFRFNDEIRPHIIQLIELARYAASREDGSYCNQSTDPKRNGVYGHVSDTIVAIVWAEIGPDFAEIVKSAFSFGDMETSVVELEERVAEYLSRDESMELCDIE